MFKNKSNSENRTLARNTVMLFILTFSNYVFNFITIPYQTRILQPEVFGNISFAMSAATYFQLLIDFGFIISATEDVSKAREDKSKISEILTSITVCKSLLCLLSYIILGVLCIIIPRFREDVPLLFLYLTSYSIYTFLPDFFYRGIENMQAITIRSVCIKMFTVIMIFMLLKKPSQYYLIPVLTGIGNLAAVISAFIHIKRLGYGFSRVKKRSCLHAFKRSSFFFTARIASTVFTTANTLILGVKFGENSALLGHYATAEKAVNIAKQSITPISDSLYPYMVKRRNFKMIKKALIYGVPLFFAGCLIVIIWANPICAFIFGEKYYASGRYLRLLAPVAFFAYPSTILGFPALSPLGLSKYVNISTFFGAAVQILLLTAMYFITGISAVNICISTCITEFSIFAFRAVTVCNKLRANTFSQDI